jgi:uncharacterized protein YbjT (DUF2867 family)
MTILVTGATGTVGRHVVRALQQRHLPVRAFDRSRQTLAEALTGVDELFLACGNVPDQVAFECAAIDAAAAAGVRRVVKLSGPDAAVDSPLLFERWHGEIEAHLTRSGLPAVMLRPRTYMTNLMAYAGTVAESGLLPAPAGDAKISFVDPRDVAESAVECLTGAGHEGHGYALTGPEAITYDRVAEELSAATGRPVRYLAVSDEDARRAMIGQGLPPPVAEAIVAIFASQRAGSMTTTTDAVRALTGHEPRSIATFARDHAAAFRPGDSSP